MQCWAAFVWLMEQGNDNAQCKMRVEARAVQPTASATKGPAKSSPCSHFDMTWLRIGLWGSAQAGICRDCLGVQPGLARISRGFTWCDDVYKGRLSVNAIHVAQQENHISA